MEFANLLQVFAGCYVTLINFYRSTSSEDTVPITNTAAHAPTPPPRPQPHVVKPVASPLPKPRTSVTKPPVKDTSSASG